MINYYDLVYLLPLIFICILLVTGAYKKDYSLTIILVALFVAGLEYNCTPRHSLFILMSGFFIILIRAIVNHEFDSWVKR